jgi:hypothetical protein
MIREPILLNEWILYELDLIEIDKYNEVEPRYMELGIRNKRKGRYDRTGGDSDVKSAAKSRRRRRDTMHEF